MRLHAGHGRHALTGRRPGHLLPRHHRFVFVHRRAGGARVRRALLRISQGHAAASHAEKAKKVELEAETLTSAADAKVAYLNWVRAKGQAFVAKQAVDLAKAHVDDVKRVKAAASAPQADVLRGEAQVAAADQAFVEVGAFASIAEEQVRIGLNLPKGQALTIGIAVMNIAPPTTLPQLSTLQDQAMDKRLEIPRPR